MLNSLLLFAGLGLLIAGTRLVIRCSVGIAQYYRLSDFFIGVVILAFGSDLPEIVISVDAALHRFAGQDTSGVIVGNVIGSAFSQIGLIMGVTGLFGYLTLTTRRIYLHGGILLGALLYLFLASLDGIITRGEGGVLILAFVIYLFMLYFAEKDVEVPESEFAIRLLRTWGLLLLGMALVIGGSELTVQSTIALAQTWGVSQSFIAIVIIGIGTSLPELAISIYAVLNKRGGMSVGNLIGSNILDSLLPVGLAAAIYPVTVAPNLVRVDMVALFALSFLVLLLFRRTRGLQKPEATILIVAYGAYLAYKLATV